MWMIWVIDKRINLIWILYSLNTEYALIKPKHSINIAKTVLSILFVSEFKIRRLLCICIIRETPYWAYAVFEQVINSGFFPISYQARTPFEIQSNRERDDFRWEEGIESCILVCAGIRQYLDGKSMKIAFLRCWTDTCRWIQHNQADYCRNLPGFQLKRGPTPPPSPLSYPTSRTSSYINHLHDAFPQVLHT